MAVVILNNQKGECTLKMMIC